MTTVVGSRSYRYTYRMADSRTSDDLPSTGDVATLVDNRDFNEEERLEIEQEIEQLIRDTDAATTARREDVAPRRSGVFFPIIINVVLAAAAAAGIYFLGQLFQSRGAEITVDSQGFLSTEGQLLEQVRRESEEQLAAKDAEITDIQSQLQQVDAERRNLEENLAEELSAREAQLRSALQAELEAERSRLSDAGQSEAEIEAQIDALEAERRAELEQALEAERQAAQEQLAAQQAQLDARSAELEQTLADSQAERTRLEQQAAEREAELGAEIEALEQETADAQARLATLQSQQEQAELLSDQIFGSFESIINDIQEGDTDAALDGLQSLDSLLISEARILDADQRRTQRALVTALRQLVREVALLRDNLELRAIATTEEQALSAERERAVEMIQAASGVIELAGEAVGAGRYTEARTLYEQALATIPSLEEVYPAILDLEAERRRSLMEGAVAEADAELAAGRTDAAIGTYLQALRELATGEDDPVWAVASGIADATEANQEALLTAQQQQAAQLRGQIDTRDAQIGTLNQRLLQAQNEISRNEVTLAELEEQVSSLQQQLEQQRQALASRSATLEQAQRELTAARDELEAAAVDLAEARARTQSLQTRLDAAREEADEAEAEASSRIAALEEQVSALESERAALENQVTLLRSQIADLEEAQARGADEEAVAEYESQIRSLQSELAESESLLASSRNELADAQTLLAAQASGSEEQLVALRDERDKLTEELDAARARASSLEQRNDSLTEARDAARAEVAALSREIEQLRGAMEASSPLAESIASLSAAYQRNLSRATSLSEGASVTDLVRARDQLLASLESDAGEQLLPGFTDLLSEIDQQIYALQIGEAEAAGRTEAAEDLAAFTRFVQERVDEAEESAEIDSRIAALEQESNDLAEAAREIRELVALASRGISAAPSVSYRLLGSVSRVVGDRLVVERLVALELSAGDRVEIRRSPGLGQEIAIAGGEITDVEERRVLISTDQLFTDQTTPQERDLVYIVVEEEG